MISMSDYLAPPVDTTEEWLEGYYAALRRVGAFLTAEADRQSTPTEMVASQPARVQGFLPASYLWRDTEPA